MSSLRALRLLACIIAVAACGSDRQQSENLAASSDVVSSRLSELLGNDDRAVFPLVMEPRTFRFPEDHGAHPEYRNEWWYLTGNLDSSSGRRYGYELTLFRFALAPSTPGSGEVSNWRSRQVYIGHLALTDVARDAFHVAQRYSRAALGLAGATGNPLRVWLEDWSIVDAGATNDSNRIHWEIAAMHDDFGIRLEVETAEPPVLHGDRGLSRKSAEPGNASYYYSVPRLATSGEIRVGSSTERVNGLSWLDREWGSSALAANQQGWDWFALQLEDGSNLMFYRLRRDDGSVDPMSAGTWMPAAAAPQLLAASDVSLDVRRYWDSPLGGRYPLAWRMRIAKIGLDLEIEPVIDAQELLATVRYWEGAVDTRGRLRDARIGGRGYVELTGYGNARE